MLRKGKARCTIIYAWFLICSFVIPCIVDEFVSSQLANELNKLDEKLRLNEALLEQKVCISFPCIQGHIVYGNHAG